MNEMQRSWDTDISLYSMLIMLIMNKCTALSHFEVLIFKCHFLMLRTNKRDNTFCQKILVLTWLGGKSWEALGSKNLSSGLKWSLLDLMLNKCGEWSFWIEHVRPVEWGGGVKMMVAISLLYSMEEKETGLRHNIFKKNEYMNELMLMKHEIVHRHTGNAVWHKMCMT